MVTRSASRSEDEQRVVFEKIVKDTGDDSPNDQVKAGIEAQQIAEDKTDVRSPALGMRCSQGRQVRRVTAQKTGPARYRSRRTISSESYRKVHGMNVIRSFRNLDRHGQQRAPEVIEEELRQLEPHLARFREDLVRLEVVASQTRGKTRIKVSLRLATSGVIAAREDGSRSSLSCARPLPTCATGRSAWRAPQARA